MGYGNILRTDPTAHVSETNVARNQWSTSVLLSALYGNASVAVVVDEGRVLGIINKIDLLEFINNHSRQAA